MADEHIEEITADVSAYPENFGIDPEALFDDGGIEGDDTIESGDDDTLAASEGDDTVESEPKADADGDDKPETDGEKDEDDEGDDATPKNAKESDDETTYTLKVLGEEIEVSESDLIKGWQDNAANTQKAQAHAETVRDFEAYREKEVGLLKEALAYHALPTANEPRPEEFAGRPSEFMEAYGKWQKDAERQTLADNTLKAIEADEAQRVLVREAGLLQEKIPEWSDESVRQADYASMSKVASDTYGFSPEEIAQTTDHRLLMLLRDAARVAEYESKPVVLKRVVNTKQGLSGGTKGKTPAADSAHAKAVKKINSGAKPNGEDLADALFYS